MKKPNEIMMERQHSLYLKMICQKMNNWDVTSGDEILRMGHQLFGTKFHGVYAQDTVPPMTKACYFIFNTDIHTNKGIH